MSRNGLRTQLPALLAALLLATSAQASPYIVTDLGGLGGNLSFAGDLNNQGLVVGSSFTGGKPSVMTATAYTAQGAVSLGSLGGTDGSATGVNNSGQAVGASTLDGLDTSHEHAVLFQDGHATDLGTLGGRFSYASGINDTGQIVGTSAVAGGGTHPFLYQNGAMTDLGTLGGVFAGANAINQSGQVVGDSYLKFDPAHPFEGPHAFLYQNGVMTDLGTLNHGSDSGANAINGAGQIVGASGGHAFLYQNGVMTDLGTLTGNSSAAKSINAAGQVVGTYLIPFTPNVAHAIDGTPVPVTDGVTISRAFLYQNGTMVDLNTLLPAGSPWTLTDALAINDKGQIAVAATNGDGGVHALLLTPDAQTVPEPSTLAVLGLGLLAWTRYRNKGRKRA